ncbi:MAG: hypothetical protein ACLFVU_15245, partial [Phycisphaerae bacterium]
MGRISGVSSGVSALANFAKILRSRNSIYRPIGTPAKSAKSSSSKLLSTLRSFNVNMDSYKLWNAAARRSKPTISARPSGSASKLLRTLKSKARSGQSRIDIMR